MGGRITIYNLGEQGVNLTKSPIHQSDGELLQAQNAIRSLNNVDGGLVKREALTTLTSPAMDGSVRGLIGLPLPNPLGILTFHVFRNSTPSVNIARHSTDGGATWSYDDTLVAQAGSDAAVGVLNGGVIYAMFLLGRLAVNPRMRRFYYFGAHDAGFAAGEAPPIYSYDGTNNAILCRLPGNPVADTLGVVLGLDMLLVGQLCYISTWDGTNSTVTELLIGGQHGSVYRLDENGQLTRLGLAGTIDTGGVTCLAWWGGKLWAGSAGCQSFDFGLATQAGKVYSIRPFLDTDWTVDTLALVAPDESMITSMCAFLGDLYLSTAALTGTASKIRKRTAGGTWSTVYTHPGTVAYNQIFHLTVHEGALYAASKHGTGVELSQNILRSTDGSAWTIVRDTLALDGGGGCGGFVSLGTDLYHLTGSKILRRRAGVWTSLDAAASTLRGTLASIRAKN